MLALVVFLLGILFLACLFPGFRAFLILGLTAAVFWLAATLHDAPIQAQRAAAHRAVCDQWKATHKAIHPNCTHHYND